MAENKNNKRGAVILYMLVLFALILFGMIIMATFLPEFDFYVGYNQVTVINAFEFTERAFLYLDMSVELAAEKAVERLVEQDGFHLYQFEDEQEEYPCGELVYPLLNDEDKRVSNCRPDYERYYAELFEVEFNALVSKYEALPLSQLPYDVSIERVSDDELKVRVVFTDAVGIPIYSFTDSYRAALTTPGWSGVAPSDRFVENEFGHLERGGLLSDSRGGRAVDSVVVHYTVTKDIESTYNILKRFRNSYHYIIDKDGTIYQFVPEHLAARHAGCANKPANVVCEPYNQRSIGISFISCGYNHTGCEVNVCYRERVDGKCWDPFTEEQRSAVVELLADIAERNELELTSQTVLGHSETSSDKPDPGPGFEKSVILERANRLLAQRAIGGGTT